LEAKHSIIKSFKWFGISFYERSRLSEEKIKLKFETVHCEDIGLYVIGKYPRLKYGNLSVTEDFNWNLQAIETLRLTILNLINTGVIELVKVEDKVTYLYKSFQSIKIDYCFKVSDIQVDEDWFSAVVYKTINEVNQSKSPSLLDYIRAVLDKVIYSQSTYSKPYRAFIIQLLNKYSKSFPWIQINTKSKFLGLLENHSLKVAEIYIPRIRMQHQSLSEIDNSLFRSHTEYSKFCKRLHYEIEKDFKRRRTNND
jgi:hypothetical protein